MLTDSQKTNIGLNYILSETLCFTPYGKDRVKNISFMNNKEEISRSFFNMEILLDAPDFVLEKIQSVLAHFKEIRGSINKIEAGVLNEIDFFELKTYLLTLENLVMALQTIPPLSGVSFTSMTAALDILDPKKRRIYTFSIENVFSDKLELIRKEKAELNTLPQNEENLIARGKIINLEDKEELRVMEDLTNKLRPFKPTFESNNKSLAELDFLLAKTNIVKKFGGTKPDISTNELSFMKMNNPYIEKSLNESNKDFTRVSVSFSKGTAIITGANMGGKSVALKTVLLNTLLCHYGFYVFAESASVPIFDDVFYSNEDESSNFLSTFGAEVYKINEVIKSVKNSFTLSVFDEPAKSTNPTEGSIIVKALVKHFAEQKSFTIIATHYDNIIHPKARHYQVIGLTDHNLSNICNLDDLKKSINYNLTEVTPNTPVPKTAIKLCKLLGLELEL